MFVTTLAEFAQRVEALATRFAGSLRGGRRFLRALEDLGVVRTKLVLKGAQPVRRRGGDGWCLVLHWLELFWLEENWGFLPFRS